MRVEGWESLLAEYLEREEPFRWGKNDCSLWAAGWIRIATGEDLVSAWRGQYRSEAGAARLMRQRGFRLPRDIADNHLDRVPVALARRGDLLSHPEGPLGIAYGLNGHFLTEHGLTTLPASVCPLAWKVG